MKTRLFLVVAAFALASTVLATRPLRAAAPQRQTTTVTSTADSGPGTLREMLERPSSGTAITFDPAVFPPDSPATIFILSALPELAQGQLTVDASDAGVIIDGSQSPLTQPLAGLTVTSTGNVIRGLQILHFSGGAIVLERGAQDNIVGGNRTKGAGPTGQGNVISGSEIGVAISGPETGGNIVSGNYIGTDVSGTFAIPNRTGVLITEGAAGNIVGGLEDGEANVISGNTGAGVECVGSGVRDNSIRDNLIGVDVHGTLPVPNFYGVLIHQGAVHNKVQANVVSGNNQGVTIAGRGTMANTVSGNFIGTSVTGAGPMGNEIDGVWIGEGAQYNVVGGSTPDERNIISGNLNNGVVIDASAGNIISGNYIGTDESGSKPVGNQNIGVVLAWGAQYNLVGGAEPEERNIISGNGNVGVSIANPDTNWNAVSGNFIGTDATGAKALGNALIGLHMHDGAQYNVLGGTTRGEGNLTSGNGAEGVRIEGSDAVANVVAGNYIGTDFGGTADLGNAADGIHLDNGARLNTIGPGNTVAYNGGSGVTVVGAQSSGNTITANSIYLNDGQAILNMEGGNAELPAPTITYADTRTVRGTATPNSRVEVFSDEGNQGRVFEGATEVDQQGAFAFRIPVGRLAGPHLTATCTDLEGNTSYFSSPVSPPEPLVMRELPNIVGPTQVSVEPKVVGTNLSLALFCLAFFGLTSNIFNSILKDHREELVRPAGRLVPQAARVAASRIASSLELANEKGRSGLLLMWLLLLFLTSLIESFLDPEIGVLSPERVGLLLTLFVSGVAASALESGLDLLAHRRWAPATKVESKIQWIGIVIALACVMLSRGLDFKPGYLYGIVGAVYLVPKIAGIQSCGKRATFVLISILAAAFILWIASAFLPSFLADLEALFLSIFLIALQGVFFALIPLDFTDGGDIWSWKKGVWLAFFAVVLFCFYHIVLNPNASDVRALQQNGVRTLLALVALFGTATLILWALFPLRLGRGKAAT